MSNPKKTILHNITLSLLFSLIFTLLSFSELSAQDEEEFVNDPLEKPEVWVKLKEDPSSSKLWSEYLGKAWGSMSKAEKEKVSIWRQELLLQKISSREVVITSEADDEEEGTGTDVNAGGEVMEAENIKAEEIKNAESLIMQERDEISELKTNISENFVILEDLYRDSFEEFDVEYVSYNEKHPDGNYPLPKWIEEQEARLKELKKKKLEELRATLGSDK